MYVVKWKEYGIDYYHPLPQRYTKKQAKKVAKTFKRAGFKVKIISVEENQI